MGIDRQELQCKREDLNHLISSPSHCPELKVLPQSGPIRGKRTPQIPPIQPAETQLPRHGNREHGGGRDQHGNYPRSADKHLSRGGLGVVRRMYGGEQRRTGGTPRRLSFGTTPRGAMLYPGGHG